MSDHERIAELSQRWLDQEGLSGIDLDELCKLGVKIGERISAAELTIDPARWLVNQNSVQPVTDIYVRAKHADTGEWDSVDISSLDKPSLLAWLRSRGGSNPWAENTVFILLGHAP